jgi:hypothetical protein
MATGLPQRDLSAQLDSLLLRAYIEMLYDSRWSADEQLQRQLALEHLLLTQGTEAIRRVERAFNMEDEPLVAHSALVQWFMRFASSLPEERLREVGLSTIERFWRVFDDVRIRRSAIDLIARVEVANDPTASSARGSLLVSLFRGVQPRPFSLPLADGADLIVRTLLFRVRSTPVYILDSPQGKLSWYGLKVVRYCFCDPYQTLAPEELDTIVSLAGDLNDDVRQRIYQGLV